MSLEALYFPARASDAAILIWLIVSSKENSFFKNFIDSFKVKLLRYHITNQKRTLKLECAQIGSLWLLWYEAANYFPFFTNVLETASCIVFAISL